MNETEDLTSFFETFDDAWARMFALNLGTKQPHPKVRDSFLDFITPMCSHMKQADEQDFIDLFPDFLYFLLKEEEVR
tara:strand:- start:330 stop:560 length:231 start_codon:yes stop_codon:yes gene_type:complete